MHERIFTNQKSMAPKDLISYAAAIGLDMPVFEQCLNSGKHAAEIRKDLADGSKAGVRGTPSFLLGLTQPNSTDVRATKIIRGAQPYNAFKQAIDSLLAPKK
jgi:predicted DsbA family dithiol-disulfide isomerase